MTLYIQELSIWNASYIGNAQLPLGPDPFYTAPVPPTPTPTPSTTGVAVFWIIILVVIIVVLLGFLGWAVYKYRAVQAEAEEKRGIIYNDEEAAKTALTNSEEI
jgi:heme/copper-type cytochrome/quinol oxidase subunit 2